MKTNEKVYVAKMYSHVTPTIVQEFPCTEQGVKDAWEYCAIMERTTNSKYIVLGIMTK